MHNNFILKDENAIFYECGFSCDNVIFVRLGSEAFFITDSRYTIEANELVVGAEVIESSNLVESARQILRGVKRVIYNPNEWSVGDFKGFSKLKRTYFHEHRDFSRLKRAIKSDEEIAKISKAVALGKEAFEHFATFLTNEGLDLSERRLFFEGSKALSHTGNYNLSFEPIIAINENASKPHALPTSKALQKGDLVLFDAGLQYERYCSDRTRTAFMGETLSFAMEQSFTDSKIQQCYDLVRKAHDRAIEGARSGMRASQIDKLAREVIEEGGYGKYFVHSTGHGVGLDIHEYPFISKRSDMVIEDNMVFTVEPGIYIEGEFGIRLEDMVVMRDGKASVL